MSSLERLLDQTAPNRVFDLSYEPCIENQESTTRALLNFCGLPGTPAVSRSRTINGRH